LVIWLGIKTLEYTPATIVSNKQFYADRISDARRVIQPYGESLFAIPTASSMNA
jgi:hypothetical protein